MKEYNEDSTNEKPVPLFFHKRTVRLAREAAPRLRADRILGHRVDSDGNVSFLVKHVGEDETSADYWPIKDFLEGNTLKLTNYCKENDLGEFVGILAEA